MQKLIDFKVLSKKNASSNLERLLKEHDLKEGVDFEVEDGRELMKKHFQILDITKLKPYKIKANIFKVQFKDNFIPEQNFSISTIDQLFSDEPYIIPNK
jgi:hypothetical protein